MRKTCLDVVYELAKQDERVVFIGSDLGAGTLDQFRDEMPDRFFMEGVSEQNLIGMAAGLALEGFIPYVNTIATFITRRCYEQLAVDLCLHNLPVKLIANGGGLVYAPLGPTHLAIEDMAILRALPRMTVLAPCDKEEMARLVPQKGQRYLIQAMRQVVHEFGQARLLIAGDGPLRDSLTGMRDRLGLQGHVLLLGKRDNVRHLLAISDMFVFPSLYEGLGNALLEAAASGTPCIASDIGPVREVLENDRSGILVPSQNSAAIADAIASVAREPEFAVELSEAAANDMRKRFRITHVVKQLEKVFEEALSR